MVGAINKIPLTILSMVFFGDEVTVKKAITLAFGLSGGIVFAYVKAMEKRTVKGDSKDTDTKGASAIGAVTPSTADAEDPVDEDIEEDRNCRTLDDRSQ
jgi:hypothetical protein